MEWFYGEENWHWLQTHPITFFTGAIVFIIAGGYAVYIIGILIIDDEFKED